MSSKTKRILKNLIRLDGLEDVDKVDFDDLYYVYADGRRVVLLTETGETYMKASCLDEAVFIAAELRHSWVKYIKNAVLEILTRKDRSPERDFLLDGEHTVLERRASLLLIGEINDSDIRNQKRSRPCSKDFESIIDSSQHENYPEVDSSSTGTLVVTNHRILFITSDSTITLPLVKVRKITAGIHNVCIYCTDGRKIVFGNIPGISAALYICSVLIHTENST